MSEKISERPIREEKVKRLKEKILKEINKELDLFKNDLKYDMTNGIEYVDEFEYTISHMHYLFKLRDYINQDYVFMTVINQYDNLDYVVYNVPIMDIEIWLQDDFNFTRNFLSDVDYNKYVVEIILNEQYFGFEFTSVIDKIAYEDKLEKESDVNET